MSERYRGTTHPEDLPWNDVPADSDVVYGTEEPDPAEVEGDEGEEVDISHPAVPDTAAKYQRESLDQRLAEEETDQAVHQQDAPAGEIQGAESEQDDLSLDLEEADEWGPEPPDSGPAEEAAIHIRDDARPRR
jgi:hypothetical protein